MPGARTVFWATLAVGATCSAVGGFAAERWTLGGVDPYYFGASASEVEHQSAFQPAIAQPTPDVPMTTYASAPVAYPAVRETSPETAAVVDTDHWQRRIDAEDRQWQARMDAEFRRSERMAEVARDEAPGTDDQTETSARLPQAVEQSDAASDAVPA